MFVCLKKAGVVQKRCQAYCPPFFITLLGTGNLFMESIGVDIQVQKLEKIIGEDDYILIYLACHILVHRLIPEQLNLS